MGVISLHNVILEGTTMSKTSRIILWCVLIAVLAVMRRPGQIIVMGWQV